MPDRLAPASLQPAMHNGIEKPEITEIIKKNQENSTVA